MNKYIPGVCNIGVKERESRLKMGLISLVVTLILSFLIGYLKLEINFRYLVFFPAFSASIGIYQYYFKFCVYFGVLGKYNFGNLNDKGYTNIEKEYIRNDMKKALTILFYCIITSAIYTWIVVLI